MANTALLETSDILRVLTTGDVIALPDGTQALQVYLVLNPAGEKHYPDGDVTFPAHLRMGDASWSIEADVMIGAKPNVAVYPASFGLGKETTEGTPVEAEPEPDDESVVALHDAEAPASEPQATPDALSETTQVTYHDAPVTAEQAPETPSTEQLETTADTPAPLSTTPIIVTMKDV